MVEEAGDASPLPHHVKHSPSGMSWGYHGSGAADLARSLLIHALGDAARCPVCDGSGEVVYDVVTDSDLPARAVGFDPPSSACENRYSDVMGCQECEGGCGVLPAVYQSFKREVVARVCPTMGGRSPAPSSCNGLSSTGRTTERTVGPMVLVIMSVP